MSILLPGDAEPGPSDEYPIYARSGWRIPQEKPPTSTKQQMKIAADELMRWRQRLTLRSLSPYPYNCVGMIFACRRAWIDIDHIYDILKEDGYRMIRCNQIMQGDIVLYENQAGEPSHVALIVMIERHGETLNIQVMSKWGRNPEFIHFVENVPDQLGRPVEFYTDRSVL